MLQGGLNTSMLQGSLKRSLLAAVALAAVAPVHFVAEEVAVHVAATGPPLPPRRDILKHESFIRFYNTYSK